MLRCSKGKLRLNSLNRSLSLKLNATRERGWTWYEREFAPEINDVKNKVGSSRRFLYNDKNAGNKSQRKTSGEVQKEVSVEMESTSELTNACISTNKGDAVAEQASENATSASVYLEAYLYTKLYGVMRARWKANFFIFDGTNTVRMFSDRPRMSKLAKKAAHQLLVALLA